MQHQETLRLPQLIRSDQLELSLETSYFVSTKIFYLKLSCEYGC